jgi:hypothetical protein
LLYPGVTLWDVELELTREEQERELASAAVRDAAKGTMTEYLMLGLEIEGQQYVFFFSFYIVKISLFRRRQLAADLSANKSPTTKELTDFVTRRTRISCQVKKLRVLQRKYSPRALQRLSTSSEPVDPAEAERTPLFLPSALAPAKSLPPLSVPGLALSEARLRDAQYNESLGNIWHGLIVKKQLQTYKTLNSRRQHQNTHSQGLVDGQQQKVDLGAATYRQACAAHLKLEHVTGTSGWRPLEKGDLRLPEDEEEAKRRRQRAMKGKRKEAAQEDENGEVRGVPGMGEKTRLVSWIWVSAGGAGGVVEEEMHNCVRVEWCKAYAQVKRWKEEVLLLQEEMVRCLLTLEWQAGVIVVQQPPITPAKLCTRRCIFKARWHWQRSKQWCGKSSPLASGACGSCSLTGFQGPTREHSLSHLGWTKTGSQVARESLKTSTETIPLRRNPPQEDLGAWRKTELENGTGRRMGRAA